MAKKKKKDEIKIVGQVGNSGEILPFNESRVLGRVDDNGNKTAFIQAEQYKPQTQKDTWLKKGALDDSGYGYTSGLDAFNRFNAGVLLTGLDFADNIFLGMSKPVEGIGDFGQSRTADVLEYFGKNKQAEKIRKSAAKEWKVNEQLENLMNNDVEGVGIRTSSFLGNKGVSIPQGLGSVALASMTGGVGGALGGATAANIASLGAMGIGAAGSSEQEALQEGASKKEARMYGLISGAGETLSEMMFGGLSQGSQLLGIGKGVFDSADDALASALSKKVNSKIAKTLIEAGVKASSEGVEEVVSGILNAAGKKLTYMKDEDITKLIKDENLLDSFLSGAISAGLSQAPGVLQNIQNTTKGNYKSYLTGLSENEQKVVDKVAESRFKEGMSVKEQAKIREEVKDQLTNLELTSDEINSALDSEMIGDPSDTYLHQIVQNEESIFMPTEEDMTGDKRRLNKNLSIEDAQEKIKTLANDFMKEENDIRNTRAAHKLFNEMKNVIEATGEQVRLTSYKELENQGVVKLLTNENGEAIRDAKGRLQYTDNNGKLIGINGFRSENGITLNANSNALFEATMGHEIGESIKANSVENYNELRNLVTELGKIDGTLTKETMDALRKSYGELGERTDSYLDEYVNDKLGELFTNDSKLINELGKKPSLMQRVIDEVKYLVKKFTTKSPEGKRLLELQHNLENKLQESVRELNVNNKTQQGTQYQLDEVQKTSDLNEYVADAAVRNAQQIEADKQAIRDSINEYLEENNITNPTKEDMLNAVDTYEIMDAVNEFSDVKQAEKLVSEVADEMLKENTKNTKYSLSEDNNGRKLTEAQNEYFKDSKARDDNGNLVTVYHTTTDKVAQFNEFDPTGTDYYKFGDQVVNYFTDDKNMSGSYADQYYEMADTKKLTSIEEVNKYLKQFNDSFNTEYNPSGNADYVVREENGKYNVYNDVEKGIIDSANDFISTLNQEEKDFIKNIFKMELVKPYLKIDMALHLNKKNILKNMKTGHLTNILLNH